MRLGEHDTSTLSDGKHEDIKVSRVDKHPEYNPRDYTNDVAILTLARDVDFGCGNLVFENEMLKSFNLYFLFF